MKTGTLVFFLLLGHCAHSQESAGDVLTKFKEACSKLKSVKYTCFSQTSYAGIMQYDVKQEAADVKNIGFGNTRIYANGRVKKTANGAVKSFVMAYDGTTFSLKVSDTLKTLTNFGQSIPIREMAIAGIYPDVFMVQFFEKEPFKWLYAKNAKIALLNDTLINGSICYSISSSWMVEGMGEAKPAHTSLYISKSTYLPVAVKSERTWTSVEIININPIFQEDEFVINNSKQSVTISTPTAQIGEVLANGTMAPLFTLKDEAGNLQSIKDYRGKLVLLDFWGLWCVPCLKMMPSLQKLHEKYNSKGLVVVGISTMDGESNPAQYMKQKGYSYKLWLNGETITSLFKVNIFPTIYLIDKDGKIIFSEQGMSNDSHKQLDSLINSRLINQ